MKHLYTAVATNKGGRAGHVETDDKRLIFDLTPSASKTGTNPEQLFAAGYSSCFGSALDAVAKKDGLDARHSTVTASVDLNQDDEGGFFISVALDIIFPNTDEVLVEQLVQKAHKICPYSKATRGNIDVTLSVGGRKLEKAA